MKHEPRVSLAHVAREAGVSRMTVSLALREDGRIPAKTRNRVSEIARRLGYKPNPVLSRVMTETARTRHGNHIGTIAFLITEPTGKDFAGDSDSFLAAAQRAGDHGYTLERFWITDPNLSAARSNRILWSRGVEGLIIPNLSHAMYARGERTLPIDWEKFCAVEIADNLLEPVLNRVRHNHFSAMINAFEELEKLGYRRIGFCTSTEVDLRTHHRWQAAFLLWRSMRPSMRTVKPLLLEEITGEPLIKWIGKNRLDAILSPGLVALQKLREGGLNVPGDIGFATLDAWGTDTEKVTGIDQQRAVLAGFAVDMLVTLLHRQARGIPDYALDWILRGTWICGTTTRPQGKTEPLTPVDAQALRS